MDRIVITGGAPAQRNHPDLRGEEFGAEAAGRGACFRPSRWCSRTCPTSPTRASWRNCWLRSAWRLPGSRKRARCACMRRDDRLHHRALRPGAEDARLVQCARAAAGAGWARDGVAAGRLRHRRAPGGSAPEGVRGDGRRYPSSSRAM